VTATADAVGVADWSEAGDDVGDVVGCGDVDHVGDGVGLRGGAVWDGLGLGEWVGGRVRGGELGVPAVGSGVATMAAGGAAGGCGPGWPVRSIPAGLGCVVRGNPLPPAVYVSVSIMVRGC
jgi:hypothetical protein